MDLEERVEALERTAHEHAVTGMVMDIVVRALIVSHPNRAGAALAMEALLNDRELRLQDHAFDTGRKPSTAGSLVALIRQQAQGWLALFRA